VVEVARRYGVTEQTMHGWLRRYAGEGWSGRVGDRSSRLGSCPHQMPAVIEAMVCGAPGLAAQKSPSLVRRAGDRWHVQPSVLRWTNERSFLVPTRRLRV
jgi:hypothetical protein